jgi:hypothetical protein
MGSSTFRLESLLNIRQMARRDAEHSQELEKYKSNRIYLVSIQVPSGTKDETLQHFE